jgi:hypothetical protein
MGRHEIIGIHPPYQAFYYHSMAFITASAAQSAKDLNRALKSGPSCLDDAVLNPVQNIVLQAAALSRYFWPAYRQDIHSDRAEFLRRKFKIEENSSLKSRDLRNALEHFDERLDKYLEKGIVGHIIPQFVGDLSGDREVPVHVFRAFDPTSATFEILGERFLVEPLYEELMAVHIQLAELL